MIRVRFERVEAKRLCQALRYQDTSSHRFIDYLQPSRCLPIFVQKRFCDGLKRQIGALLLCCGLCLHRFAHFCNRSITSTFIKACKA